jgi:hypothetical protein
MTTPAIPIEFDVHAIDPVFGVGKKLGRVQAADRAAADELARQEYGAAVLVTLAGGRPRRRRAEPKDLGNSPSRRSP